MISTFGLVYVEFLGELLQDASVPMTPSGINGIFLDGKRFFPQIPQNEYPAQRLVDAIYEETGIRSSEWGNVAKGRDSLQGTAYLL
jgi:tryptophanase